MYSLTNPNRVHAPTYIKHAHTCAQLKSTLSEASNPQTISRDILCPSSEMWAASESLRLQILGMRRSGAQQTRLYESTAVCPKYRDPYTPPQIKTLIGPHQSSVRVEPEVFSTFDLERNRCQHIHNTHPH